MRADYWPEPSQPVGLEWTQIETEEHMTAIMKLYENFEDAVIVSCRIETGNAVDSQLCPDWSYQNRLYLLFQRECNNPFSIELLCDHVTRFHFFALDGYTPDMRYAKLVKNNDYYYWTEWYEFDPFNQEHLDRDDFPMVECEKMYYRIVQMEA